MKKFLLLLSLNVAFFGLYAQSDTIRYYDFNIVGNGFEQHLTEDISISYLPVQGENQTWDFTSFTEDKISIQLMKDISEAPDPDYQDATQVNNIDDTEWYYIKKDETGLSIIGVDDGSGVVIPLVQKLVAPESYYLSYDSSASIFSGITIISIIEGVGYGSLSTPAGTFNDVILTKQSVYQCYSVPVTSLDECVEQQNLYTWNQKTSPILSVAQLSYFPSTNNITFSWHKGIDNVTSLAHSTEEQIFSVYPSLVQDHITVQGKEFNRFVIVDMLGNIVYSENTGKSDHQLGKIAAGNYIYKIIGEGKILHSGKIIKN